MKKTPTDRPDYLGAIAWYALCAIVAILVAVALGWNDYPLRDSDSAADD